MIARALFTAFLLAANLPAAMAGTRVSPIDGGNLNRSFPGDPGVFLFSGSGASNKVISLKKPTLLKQRRFVFIRSSAFESMNLNLEILLIMMKSM
jgi:hypothetical protein